MLAAPCGPFVQHGLPQGSVHLLQRHPGSRLLFRLQFREALGPLQVAQRACLRGSTYFINTTTTYCTVLLRIPKSAVWRGFRPCFGFRRWAIAIPKKARGPFFGIVDRILLWITFGGGDALVGQALGEHLQPRRQGASGQHRVVRDLLEGVESHHLNGLGRMPQRLADQGQVVGVELHRLERRQRFVVQDVEVAEDATGLGVAPSSHEAQPARQAQQRQRPRHGLMGGLACAGHRRQPAAQLLIGGKCRDAIVVEHQSEHLPGVALQRCQAAVEEQPPRHALVPIATEQEGVAGRRRRGRWSRQGRGSARAGLGREVLQRSVEQVGECDGARALGSWGGVVHGHGLAQSLIDPVPDRGPDHRERQ